ncbi:MAG: reverse transcriptase-like protein [Sphingomonadales bacterium]|nr:reverse transcriptase-like protein [Sphingomonadales bacterium]
MDLKVYFDGGCRPNPGLIETAVVARGVTYLRSDLGEGDNNDAEWRALIHAARVARSLGAVRVILLGDSALVVNQASGDWPCRASRFAAAQAEFREWAASFDRWRVRRVGRSQNLAGIALEQARWRG